MLTFEEWRKLPDKEKGEREKELSAHDRFLVRQGGTAYMDIDEEVDINTPFMQKINKLWQEIEEEKKKGIQK